MASLSPFAINPIKIWSDVAIAGDGRLETPEEIAGLYSMAVPL